MKKLDANDLHVARGLDEVRRQALACLAAANDAAPAPPVDEERPPWVGDDTQVYDNNPRAPLDYQARLSLEDVLRRFVLTVPDSKIWDEEQKTLLKKTAARDLFGKALFDEWLNHDARRSIHQDMVKPIAARRAMQGGGELGDALRRYTYLYPTSEAWDGDTLQKVPLASLRFAIANCFDDWIKHPTRQVKPIDNLVFDPQLRADPTTHINRFRGLPLKPVRDDSKCRAIRELLLHLCNHDAAIYDWVNCWLAYPLQHLGAKMATALVFHSPTEGTGKSLFFQGVMRAIYGEYGITLGQHELESQYNDWISGKLYGLFEEVLARDQKYNQMGLIKHLITGDTVHISQKFVSSWEERNHVNLVFLSNEIVPLVISDSDRRSMVVSPQFTLPIEIQAAVHYELNNGGAEAFYGYLRAYPLRDFSPHSKPLMTDAKADLVDACRSSWEVFLRSWLAEELPLPIVPCKLDDLFRAYRFWAEKGRENVVSRNKFSAFLSATRGVTRRRDVWVSDGYRREKATMIVPSGADVPPGGSQDTFYGDGIRKFQQAMDENS